MHRKTPRKARSSEKEPVEVFCRIKPIDNGVKCIKVVDTKTILVTHPELLSIGQCPAPANCKEIQYEFRQVFDEKCSQKDVFDRVAFPLVRGLINGCNGLLFTYGVTGSGKTFTMNGNPRDGGILPRTLDVLFNSIANVQARKFIFKPDRLNGFDVQTEVEAKVEFQKELLQQQKVPKTPRRIPSNEHLSDRVPDLARVKEVDEDCLYSVFVSHIEIYNNHIYDLLDDFVGDGRSKNPQSKILREDSNRNMFVHGVNEVEVTSTEEAFEIFYKGQKRKRMAHTCLNAESSRSHSVFTLRLVQAPLNSKGDDILLEKNIVSVSQLSMVDLAGSERTNRTNNSGQRLREAGNINNSLMTLRTCFEFLRENQANGTSKVIPYRQSRLTHLFKTYFDGEGQVKMIVCVNPKADDYDETVHVLKFAEMSQEIHVTRPNPVRHDLGFTPGRRKANNNARIENGDCRNAICHDLGMVYSLGPAFPPLESIEPENADAIKSLIAFLQMRQEKRSMLVNELLNKQQAFRNRLMKIETESVLARQEVMTVKATLEMERKKNTAVENKYVDLESCCSDLEFKIHEKDEEIQALKNELEEVKASLSNKVLEKEKEKQRIKQKMLQDKQKASKDIQQKQKELRNEFMTQMRVKDEKLRLVKEIIASESLNMPSPGKITPSSSEGDLPSAASAKTPKPSTIPPISWALPADQPPGTPVASTGMTTDRPHLRHRRSKSASSTSGVWLAHCPVVSAVPLSTVLQPKMKKKKSVTQLTDIKDLSNSKTSKYCLTTQETDSGGEIETRLYKGDVVSTNGGGCQVVFSDVETLKQVSPTRISTKRRSGEEIAKIIAMHDDAAAGKPLVSREGHGKKPRK
ncbi:kinesin-like protein KIF23 [Ischnura elegans]|uniref:kinesin-like protein KIF23 n=1 Tax=Ischnura elegans TaxID=197161 RepID=UPI001ED8A156|nr:kinesin-like protein KIF23 [Ischnura elegans]